MFLVGKVVVEERGRREGTLILRRDVRIGLVDLRLKEGGLEGVEEVDLMKIV